MEIEPIVVENEKVVEVIKPIEINEEKNNSTEPIKIIETTKTALVESTNTLKLNININDKFRFINELFAGNTNEYNIAIEQLNSANSLSDAKNYFIGIKNIYAWKDNNDLVKVLETIIEKRFL